MVRRSDNFQENSPSRYRGDATRSARYHGDAASASHYRAAARSSRPNSTGNVEAERVPSPQRRRALTPREKYEAASRKSEQNLSRSARPARDIGSLEGDSAQSRRTHAADPEPQRRRARAAEPEPQRRTPAAEQQPQSRRTHAAEPEPQRRASRSSSPTPARRPSAGEGRSRKDWEMGPRNRRRENVQPRHSETERPRRSIEERGISADIPADREVLVSNAKEKLSGLASKAQSMAKETKRLETLEGGSTLAEERSPHILPAFFLGLISALLVLGIVLPDSDFSQTENRQLQVAPEVSVGNFLNGTFQSEFQTYVEDQFPFRDMWVTLKSAVSTISGRVENNGVYRCGDGTLVLEFVAPEKDSAAEAVVKFTEAHKDDMTIYTLVSPTAAGIWSYKLPSQVVVDDQKAYLEGINNQFAEAGARVVDVWKAFEAKKDFDLFYRTDHHWTTYGAQLAYMNLANEMGMNVSSKTYNDLVVKSDFAGSLTAQGGYFLSGTDELHVYLRSDQDVPCVVTYTSEKEKASSPYDSSALDKRDAYEVFFGGNHSLIEIDCYAENSRGTLLVIKDSFANSLIPFLIGDYEHILVVDPRYYTEDLETLVESNNINDVLFLYNATTFAQDTSLSRLVEGGLASLPQNGGNEG